MPGRSVKVWFDPEGDFLEVLFEPSKSGYFRETDDDRVMERVDETGAIIGFSILGVSGMRAESPVAVVLKGDLADRPRDRPKIP